MPLTEAYFQDKRLRTSPAGKEMRRRVEARVRSGEVNLDWRTAPFQYREELQNRLRVFEGQIPDDPLDQARFIEAEQQERTKKAEMVRASKAQPEQAPQKGSPEGQGGASGGEGATGRESGAQGLSAQDRSMFVQGDPSRGMKASATAEGSTESEMAFRQADSREPALRMGDITGAFDAAADVIPDNAPAWYREGVRGLYRPVEFASKMTAQMGGGFIESGQNIGHSIDLGWMALKKAVTGLSEYETAYQSAINDPAYDPVLASPLGVMVERPKSVSGSIARTIGQFVPTFAALIATTKGVGLSGGGIPGAIGRDVFAGAVADYAVFNAMEGNLHTLMRSAGTVDLPGMGPTNLDNAYTQFMDASESDTHMEGKFKNMLEGFFLTAGVEAIFRGGQLTVRAGKMSREQARNMAEAVVRASKATRQARELKYRAMYEEGMTGLREDARERLTQFHGGVPSPTAREMKNLSKIALSTIARGAMTIEQFAVEWGKKRGYGVEHVEQAWRTGQALYDDRGGRALPLFSRLEQNVMRMPAKQPVKQYRNALLNNPDIKRDEVRFSGVLDFLEEKERLGQPVTRAEIVEFLDEAAPVHIEQNVYGMLKGMPGREAVTTIDPLGYRSQPPVQMLPEEARTEMRQRFVEERLELEKARYENEIDSDREDALQTMATNELYNNNYPEIGSSSAGRIKAFEQAVFGEFRPEWVDEDSMIEALDQALVENLDVTQNRSFSELRRLIADGAIRQQDFILDVMHHYKRRFQTRFVREKFDDGYDRQALIDQFSEKRGKELESYYEDDEFGLSIIAPEARGQGYPAVVNFREGSANGVYYTVPEDVAVEVEDMIANGADFAEVRDALMANSPQVDTYEPNALARAYEKAADLRPEMFEDYPTRSGRWQSYQVDPSVETYEEIVYQWRQNPQRRTVERRKALQREEAESLSDEEFRARAETEGGGRFSEDGKGTTREQLLNEAMERYGPTGRHTFRGDAASTHYGELGGDQLVHSRISYTDELQFDEDGDVIPVVQSNAEEFQSDWTGNDLVTAGGQYADHEKAVMWDKEVHRLEKANAKFREVIEEATVRMKKDLKEEIRETLPESIDQKQAVEQTLFSRADSGITPYRAHQQIMNTVFSGDLEFDSAMRDSIETLLAGLVQEGRSTLPTRDVLRMATEVYANELNRAILYGRGGFDDVADPREVLFQLAPRLQDEEGLVRAGEENFDMLLHLGERMIRVYDEITRAMNAFPEGTVSKAQIDKATMERRKYLRGPPEPPMARDELWQDFAIRDWIRRSIQNHGASRLTLVTGQWQSFNWGNNPIAFRVKNNKLYLAVTDRIQPSPHRMDDDSLDRVDAALEDRLMIAASDSEFSQGRGIVEATDDSAMRSDFGVDYHVVNLKDGGSDGFMEDLAGRFGRVQAARESQREKWARRVMKAVEAGETAGAFDPFKEGRVMNYDEKLSKKIENNLKKMAEGKEDKKKVKRYLTRRKWGKVEDILQVEEGVWRVRVEQFGRGRTMKYTIEAVDYVAAKKIAEEELATTPVWTYDIPESVKRNVAGGVQIMETAGAAVGLGAIAGSQGEGNAAAAP